MPPAAEPANGAPNDLWGARTEYLFSQLRTSAAGLSEEEAAKRLITHGRNVVASETRSGPLRLLIAQFGSPVTVLLFVASVISIAVGERVDGSIILGILLVSTFLGFWQEHHAANAVAALLSLVRTNVMVLRGGQARSVPMEEVVPGDVVQLTAGSAIPGDARLIEERDLFVDQSALTGESYPAEKAVGDVPADASIEGRTNVVFLGTHAISGTATALVVRTGTATLFGDIAQGLTRHPVPTEFEVGVKRFGYLLMGIAGTLGVLIFAINIALHRPPLETLLFTLALTVGLTPQLLPAIVSVTLAQGARHMCAQRVIVRRLASIEDLGGMQILCTDKTGTITDGIVKVRASEDWTGAASDRVQLYAYLNATFESGFVNPIDEALRALPAPAAAASYTKADEVPYDFVRRRLSVAVMADGKRTLITKGSLAAVLDTCDRAENAAGTAVPLDGVRAAIQERFESLSRDGYRCLGVAYRELTDDHPITREDERGMVFVGILSLADPLKANAAKTLSDLADLGIKVKLITGDNRLVAARVAAEAGLDTKEILTGTDLKSLDDAALAKAAPGVDVFAEIEPNQKERIIIALRKSGTAVGYLGDGINDASALHAADVGISVESASDVTKQAADIVLLDTDLGVLCAGVREGRKAFANTLKYVYITTSANFGNMFSMAGASLFATFLPLLPKQILLINVLTDLPAMAIAMDRLDPELVERPRRWDNRSIGRFMVTFGLVSSLFDYITFGSLLLMRVSPTDFRTGWFAESVLSELLILLVIRTRRAFFKSAPDRVLLALTVSVAVITLALPFTPVAGLLGFAPPAPSVMWAVLGIVLAYVATSEFSKQVILRRVPL